MSKINLDGWTIRVAYATAKGGEIGVVIEKAGAVSVRLPVISNGSMPMKKAKGQILRIPGQLFQYYGCQRN